MEKCSFVCSRLRFIVTSLFLAYSKQNKQMEMAWMRRFSVIHSDVRDLLTNMLEQREDLSLFDAFSTFSFQSIDVQFIQLDFSGCILN